MKVFVFLVVFSIFTVSSVYPLSEGSRELKKEHFRIHKIKVTENLWNYYFPNNNNNTNNDKSIVKNAILIIVGDNQDEDVWKIFEENHSFPIEGFLNSCKKSHAANHSLSLGNNKNCQCKKLLINNINELITWAQLIKEMDTAIISSNNFILPSILYHGNLVHDHGKYENRNEPTFLHKQQLENVGRLNNANNWPTSPSSVLNINFPTNQSNTSNAFWNFISKLSQMHSLIFKTIFRAIGKNISHDRIPSQHKSILPIGLPKFINLISNTLMDLKLAANSKGFLLIVVTPGDQLSTVYQIIASQVSFNETLMVVTGKCSKDERAIPYYASGLKPHLLLNTTVVFELPIALKSTLDDYHGVSDNKTFPLTISITDGPKKRKIRSEDDDVDDDETQQYDEKVEESDADLIGNEDSYDNEDSLNSDHYSSDLGLVRNNPSTSHRTTLSLAFKFILTTVIMVITY